MGAPRKNPPKDAAATIERMSAAAHGMVGIAKHFGVSRDTLKRWCEEDEALQEAYELGREIERQALHALIVADAAARKGSNGNAMFILKCKFGYRENDSSNTNVNVGVAIEPTNVMVVKDYGSDENWAARAEAQQRALMADIAKMHPGPDETVPKQIEASLTPSEPIAYPVPQWEASETVTVPPAQSYAPPSWVSPK